MTPAHLYDALKYLRAEVARLGFGEVAQRLDDALEELARSSSISSHPRCGTEPGRSEEL